MKLLLDLIGNLSSFATLHSWIKEQYKSRTSKVNMHKLDNIDLKIREKILREIKGEYDIEKLDDFVAKHSLNFKNRGLSILFSEDERKETIGDYIKKNSACDKDKTANILNEYFDLLNEYLFKNLSFETKFLKKCINDEGEHIIETIEEILDDKLKCENIYKDVPYSQAIISRCNSINSLLLNNMSIDLWRKSVDTDYLAADNLANVFLRVEKLLQSFNIDKFDRLSGNSSNEPIESLMQFVLTSASDFSVELNEYYNKVIIPTVNCINGYEDKDKDFHMSIGALGLYNDNSDEKIYRCVMNNLLTFFTKVCDVLSELWKDKNYEYIENIVSNEMHKYIYHRIKYHFDDKSKLMLKMIYDRNLILDTDLANEFGYNISYVRKTLYSATKAFLGYKYNDKKSTKLYIDGAYRATIKKYYNELFNGVAYEE
ncbi:hypothetical protein JMF89_04085 [Clostridiaceae bacterium UIB06]|uniref:Uncharacterized protein n=1 Tax=Clostridium thailandense TaxID=2794346 RepID=A0A949TJF0_9CLOT|nr:hypothetical protein [Clostridium thailandense]MBV7271637.1 hypothetical protein [Clostridium thailandense]MCH5136393.1 hypothetical protein [Clostridiaceae bacterium UIB06]